MGLKGIILGTVLAGVLFVGSPFAHATSDAAVLGVSSDSAMRQILANIDDWQNEQAQAAKAQNSSCYGNWFERLFSFLHHAKPLAPLELPQMPTYLDNDLSLSMADPQAATPKSDAGEAVTTYVQRAFDEVALLDSEQTELQNLQNRELDTSVDVLELAITGQSLAISVSNRLFAATIEGFHERVLEESNDGSSTSLDTCTEARLRILRDSTMTDASQSLLNLYRDYNNALAAQIAQQAQDAGSTTPAPLN